MKVRTFFLILLTLSVSSCSISPKFTKPADEIVEKTQAATAKIAEPDTEVIALARQSARSWPGPQTPIRARRQPSPLPAAIHSPIEITLVESTSLRTVARFLSEHSGVPILVAEGHPDREPAGSELERQRAAGAESHHRPPGSQLAQRPPAALRSITPITVSGRCTRLR